MASLKLHYHYRRISLLVTLLIGVVAAYPFAFDITSFRGNDYNGGPQNWGIDILDGKYAFFGNDEGLLAYNGNDWTLLADSATTTIRDVMCVDDRVYVAGDNAMGYWSKNQLGQWNYISLLSEPEAKDAIGNTFWDIAYDGKDIYFHSFSNILRLSDSDLTQVVRNEHFSNMFAVGDKVFAQRGDGAVCILSEGEVIPFIPADKLHGLSPIRFFIEYSGKGYVMGLTDGDIVSYDNGIVSSLLTISSGDFDKQVQIECGIQGANGILAVGTIGDGLFFVNLNNLQVTPFDKNALPDQNIHDIKFISDNDIVLTHDNGISRINFDPELRVLKTSHDIGVFIDGVSHDGQTYIATNRHLYKVTDDQYYTLELERHPLKMSSIKGSLLVGTTTGVYQVNDNEHPQLLIPANGVRQFEYISDHGDEYIFANGYAGLFTIRYEGGSWHENTYIHGSFDYSSFMPENLNTIWAINPEQGLYRMHVNSALNEVERYEHFTHLDNYHNIHRIGLFKANNRIYFYSPKGIYSYNPENGNFDRKTMSDSIRGLSNVRLIKPSLSGKHLWIATDKDVSIYTLVDEKLSLQRNYSLADNPLVNYDHHYNLAFVNDSMAIASTYNGAVAINFKTDIVTAGPAIILESCTYVIDSKIEYAQIDEHVIVIPANATDIRLKFTTGLSSVNTYFSYSFSASSDEWSQWQHSGIIHFNTLRDGSYSLNVKTNLDAYYTLQLTVQPPFYKRPLAIATYILFAIGLISLCIWYYYHRQKQRLNNQLKEEQRRHEEEMKQHSVEILSQKVKAQEADLMNNLKLMTQKQELIEEITSEVNKQKKELGDRWPNKLYYRLIKLLDSGATEIDKTLSFENFFVEIHKDFMTRMQNAYPQLTQSELRLCCLLKANLSTKEIAAVMGVEPRSIEVKKYRLKKKLSLDTDASLLTHIFSI